MDSSTYPIYFRKDFGIRLSKKSKYFGYITAATRSTVEYKKVEKNCYGSITVAVLIWGFLFFMLSIDINDHRNNNNANCYYQSNNQ